MDARKAEVDAVMSGAASDERALSGVAPAAVDSALAAVLPTVPKAAITKWRRSLSPATKLCDAVGSALAAKWPAMKRGRKRRAPDDGGAPEAVAQALKYARLFAGQRAARERLANLPAGDCSCCICFDGFDAALATVSCGDHATCLACFEQYCVESVGAASADSVKCPSCPRRFPAGSVRAALPPLSLERMEAKGRALDARVALGAGDVVAKLFCECGVVGFVEREQVGDGVVTCLCGSGYCLKCGHGAHPGRLCPPASKETLRWIDRHARKCPGCGDAVQKNGGCQHYTHSRASGGCGHEFCWLCMGDWRGHDFAACRNKARAGR